MMTSPLKPQVFVLMSSHMYMLTKPQSSYNPNLSLSGLVMEDVIAVNH